MNSDKSKDILPKWVLLSYLWVLGLPLAGLTFCLFKWPATTLNSIAVFGMLAGILGAMFLTVMAIVTIADHRDKIAKKKKKRQVRVARNHDSSDWP